jgi:hypothetical protein
VVAHPARELIGSIQDPKIFVWFFAWWPHAILHGENPIITYAVDDRIPPAFDLPIVHALVDDAVTVKDGKQVLAFARRVGAGAILVDPSDPTPWRSILAVANPPRETGGLLLYQLDGRACANR